MDGPAAWRVLETDPASPGAMPSGDGDDVVVRHTGWVPIAMVAVAAVLAVGAFVVAAAGGHAEVAVDGAASFDTAGGSPSGAPAARSSASLLVIDVQGAVGRPGIVRLVSGSRVADAIAAAGGYSPRVASDRVPSALNLAALLRDGDQVIVPSRDDPSGPSPRPASGGGGGPAASQPPNGPLDLNSATAEELDALPGIGPVTAAKIVAARGEQRFAAVDDLRTRKLVGASTFDKLKALVTVR